MTTVIRCAGWADGRACEHVGMYLQQYNPEADNGRGVIVWTPDKTRARQFETTEAFDTWRMVPSSRPVRPDGKPNRPLTAYHVVMEQLP